MSLGQTLQSPSLVLVTSRKDTNNVSCRRDMTKILLKAAENTIPSINRKIRSWSDTEAQAPLVLTSCQNFTKCYIWVSMCNNSYVKMYPTFIDLTYLVLRNSKKVHFYLICSSPCYLKVLCEFSKKTTSLLS